MPPQADGGGRETRAEHRERVGREGRGTIAGFVLELQPNG